MMKLFIVLLVGGICATQYQLWAGRASWFRLQEMRQTLAEQRAENDRLRARNDELSAELYSLEHNRDAIEERARSELNMISSRELLFRVETLEEAKRGAAAKTPLPIYESPDIKAGSAPTFEPKNADLYHAPKNLRAPKARDRRE